MLSGPARDRLANCGAREVIFTNTLPIPEEKRFPGLTVLSIAPLLASTIQAVFEDGSVTSLFDGDSWREPHEPVAECGFRAAEPPGSHFSAPHTSAA